jgi:hypothetical protein
LHKFDEDFLDSLVTCISYWVNGSNHPHPCWYAWNLAELIFISSENEEKGETPDSKILARPYVQRLQMAKLTKPAVLRCSHNPESPVYKAPPLRFVQNSVLVARFLQAHEIKSHGTLVKHAEIQPSHFRPYNLRRRQSRW